MISHKRAYLQSVEMQKRATVIVRPLPIFEKISIIFTCI